MIYNLGFVLLYLWMCFTNGKNNLRKTLDNTKVNTNEFDCPNVISIENTTHDRRSNTSTLRIMQYNVEWLFVNYYAEANCPGSDCTWHTESDAKVHLEYVSKIINELQPDILNLCEVEGCNELEMLINSTNGEQYIPYLIQGTDTSTGQNVGLLTKIDPVVNLYRTEERITYPISGSTCSTGLGSTTTGVSKHYITEFEMNGLNIVMIGTHFLAFPTDPERCVQREAQAQVLQNVIKKYHDKNYEIIVLGDFNDFDTEVIDSNENKPISQVLDIMKGLKGTYATTYELKNIAINIPQPDRYSDWWDENNNCNSTLTEFSMIDHILVSPNLENKIVNAFIYKGYNEYCGTYNSDHYPVVIDFVF